MNLKEALVQFETGERTEDPSNELFKESLSRAGALADHGLSVFREQGYDQRMFAPETTGIVIEIASLASISRISGATQNDYLRETLTGSIENIRMYSWEELVLRLPTTEIPKFRIPQNCTVFMRNANLNARDIINARNLEGAGLAERLRDKIPPRMRIMQGIRLGKISFT